MGQKQLTILMTEGLLRRLYRDVYLRTGFEITPLLLAQAAELVVSQHSVVRDRTAALIWGVDTRRYDELGLELVLETCVLRGHDPTDRQSIDGRTRDLIELDWVWLGGVRVTTPMRTAMDLGCLLPRRRALAAMDALMRAHGFTRDDMVALLPRYRRRRGVIQLRQLIWMVDRRAESARESWTRLEIIDSGLPWPEPQYWIDIDGVPTYRLDLSYPEALIAIEYDGEEFHTSDEDRARDETRRTWLRSHGWLVIVLTKASYVAGAEVSWIAEIRAALRDRAPHLLREAQLDRP